MTESNEGLPTAARIWHTEVVGDCVSIEGKENMSETFKQKLVRDDNFTELVRRSDHEKKVRVAKSEKYQEGFVNGIEKKEEDVKTLIQDKIEHVEINPKDEEIAIEQSKVLQELLDELEGEASDE